MSSPSRAISFVGAGDEVLNASSNNTDLVIPSGADSGDLLVASTAVRLICTVTPPSGWTLIESIHASSGGDRCLDMYYKIMDGNETDLNWSFSITDQSRGVIHAYRNVDTATPMLDTSLNGEATSDNPDPPNFQDTAPTAEAGDVMIASLQIKGAVTSMVAPSGMTLRTTFGSSDPLSVADEVLTGTPSIANWDTDAVAGAESGSIIGIMKAAQNTHVFEPSPYRRWNPNMIPVQPVVSLWADDIVDTYADGADVTTWPNLGSVSGDPTNSSNYPSMDYTGFTSGTRPGVKFDDVNSEVLFVANTTEWVASSTPITFLCVGEVDGLTSTSVVFAGHNGVNPDGNVRCGVNGGSIDGVRLSNDGGTGINTGYNDANGEPADEILVMTYVHRESASIVSRSAIYTEGGNQYHDVDTGLSTGADGFRGLALGGELSGSTPLADFDGWLGLVQVWSGDYYDTQWFKELVAGAREYYGTA